MTRVPTKALLMLALLGPWAGQAVGLEKGAFQGPGMEGFVKVQEYDADGDEDGVKETRVRRFRNLDGDRMFTMTTREQLWAWSVDSAASATPEGDYVLRDSDCDGRFDERYGLDEEFKVPDCLK